MSESWKSYPSDEVARHTARELVGEARAGIVVVMEDGGVHQVRFGHPGDVDSAAADVLLLYSHLFDMLLRDDLTAIVLRRLVEADLLAEEQL